MDKDIELRIFSQILLNQSAIIHCLSTSNTLFQNTLSKVADINDNLLKELNNELRKD